MDFVGLEVEEWVKYDRAGAPYGWLRQDMVRWAAEHGHRCAPSGSGSGGMVLIITSELSSTQLLALAAGGAGGYGIGKVVDHLHPPGPAEYCDRCDG